jgi:hypothetical protein
MRRLYSDIYGPSPSARYYSSRLRHVLVNQSDDSSDEESSVTGSEDGRSAITPAELLFNSALQASRQMSRAEESSPEEPRQGRLPFTYTEYDTFSYPFLRGSGVSIPGLIDDSESDDEQSTESPTQVPSPSTTSRASPSVQENRDYDAEEEETDCENDSESSTQSEQDDDESSGSEGEVESNMPNVRRARKASYCTSKDRIFTSYIEQRDNCDVATSSQSNETSRGPEAPSSPNSYSKKARRLWHTESLDNLPLRNVNGYSSTESVD